MTESKIKPASRSKVVATGASRQKRAARRRVDTTLTAESAAEPAAEADGPTAATASQTIPPASKGPSGKLGVVVALMRRPEGATVAQMGAATGWQPHSVRGALAGSLKRKHYLTIVGESGEGGRVYRIAAEQPA